ncbi:conserved hypothetical protein, partial [Ricinus communis]
PQHVRRQDACRCPRHPARAVARELDRGIDDQIAGFLPVAEQAGDDGERPPARGIAAGRVNGGCAAGLLPRRQRRRRSRHGRGDPVSAGTPAGRRASGRTAAPRRCASHQPTRRRSSQRYARSVCGERCARSRRNSARACASSATPSELVGDAFMKRPARVSHVRSAAESPLPEATSANASDSSLSTGPAAAASPDGRFAPLLTSVTSSAVAAGRWRNRRRCACSTRARIASAAGAAPSAARCRRPWLQYSIAASCSSSSAKTAGCARFASASEGATRLRSVRVQRR